MSQHDFNIANQGFPSFRTDLNNALVALATTSSGDAEPATTYANQLWYETDTNTLHIRNEANSAWLDLMVIDQTTGSPSFTAGNVGIGTSNPTQKLHLEQNTAATPIQLRVENDSATSGAEAQIALATSGNNFILVTYPDADTPNANRTDFGSTAASSYFTFSPSAAERMRIDSSGNVGIGTTTPTSIGTNVTTLDLVGSSGGGVHFERTGATTSEGYVAAVSGEVRLATIGAIPLGFRTNNIERMRIDSSGNVGIGTATPIANLTILMDTASLSVGNLSTDVAQIGTSAAADTIAFGQFTGGGAAFTERMRIDDSGVFSVGCTALSTTSTTDTGAQLGSSGAGNFFRSGNTPLIVMRQTNDGTLVDLRQGGASEGSISVSGTTVSYNGGHLSRWAQFPDNSRPELLKGTVMSNLDQMSNWDNEENEQLNCVQVSTVEGDPDVAGVFVAWDSTEDDYNDILLAMTGDMVIRIGAGVTVARGDLLMSAGDGTAKPQGDDIVRSKTIAKVTSTHVSHTYADGSYAVPCVLMAC